MSKSVLPMFSLKVLQYLVLHLGLFLKNILFIFIYLFILAALGLRCCVWATLQLWCLGFSLRWLLLLGSTGSGEHRLQGARVSIYAACGLSSCDSQALGHTLSSGAQAQLPCSMWSLPRPGIEPVTSALAGRLSTSGPPGKPYTQVFNSF